MKLSNRDIVEIVGIASVVASLIFVGLQLKLEQDIAIADAYTFGIESRKADLRSRLESQAYMQTIDELWNDGHRPDWWSEELTYEGQTVSPGASVEAMRINETLGLLEADNTYFRYQQGLIPENYWNGARDAIINSLGDPFKRAVAMSLQSGIRPVINELADSIAIE